MVDEGALTLTYPVPSIASTAFESGADDERTGAKGLTMPGTANTKLKGNCMVHKERGERGRSEDKMKVAGRVADGLPFAENGGGHPPVARHPCDADLLHGRVQVDLNSR